MNMHNSKIAAYVTRRNSDKSPWRLLAPGHAPITLGLLRAQLFENARVLPSSALMEISDEWPTGNKYLNAG